MWRGKIRELNIWKADSRKDRILTSSPKKLIQGIGEELIFYKGRQLMEADVNLLCLSARSSNCLYRAGYHTIGDIIDSIESWQDLLRIKNLGKTSAVEIITGMKKYQESLFTNADRSHIIRPNAMPEQKENETVNGLQELSFLNLSVRSYNCLRRAGYTTIGELQEDISAGKSLLEIRNLGSTCEKEILEALSKAM